MNRRTKRGGKSTKKLEFVIRTNTKILEKNPSRGGTPAKERITRLRILVKTFDESKSEKENRVFRLVLSTCVTVKNSNKDVKLYISMYERTSSIVWKKS